ncbi:MAG: DNA primase regulatory subunit PriL [Methanosarcinales archaeon]|jgi:DNA primase large subunit|nr:DNA primase regulatory subunit PriL [Methanosarcinales archaeon]
MSPEELALFPFLTETSEYVENLDFSLDALMTSMVFESVRRRGFERIMQAFDGEVSKPSFGNDKEVLSELLSYPYARILVSCVNEPAFTRRYALSEATAAYSVMKKAIEKDPDFVLDIGKDFGVSAVLSDERIRIYFSDYVRYALSMKDLSWKLINRRIEHGYVTIRREEFARLLQEAVRKRIEGSLPIREIPEEIQNACGAQTAELKAKYEEQRQNLGDADLGEVDFSMFPPCVNKALSNVREGVNLAHSMRFALVSFLLNAGMSTEDVVKVFNVSPDFNEEKTSYQVTHIAGNQYKTPSCATMQTYGNCAGKDNMCSKIRHPLGYYSALKFLAAKRKAEEDKYGKDEEAKEEKIKE